MAHSPALGRRKNTIEYFADRAAVAFYLDDSPWGLGGVLVINGCLVSYFLSPLTDIDVAIHGCKIGQSDGQQIRECLAVLVALMIWQSQ